MSKNLIRKTIITTRSKIAVLLMSTSFLFVGCGDDTSSSGTQKSGYLVDAAIEGISYSCGGMSGVTDSSGKFIYDSNSSKCSNIEFKLGTLVLGSINPTAIKSDSYLTIQELLGKSRENITDGNVTNMAILLQSLSSNQNLTNGIQISNDIASNIGFTGNFTALSSSDISTKLVTLGKTERNANSAIAHLLTTTKSLDSSLSNIDMTPNSFSFESISNVNLGVPFESGEITVDGINTPTYITISDGSSYSIDSGTTWLQTRTLVSNGAKIKVRQYSSSSSSTTATTTLNIGGAEATFTTTTKANGSVPKARLKTGQKSGSSGSDGWYATQATPLVGVERSFTRSNGIVKDNATGLEWQDESIMDTGVSFSSANVYCTNLVLASYSDWRLPTIDELFTIVDRSKINPSAFDAFMNKKADYYWSSTNYISDSNYGWMINFDAGKDIVSPTSTSGYVRCVRAGH